MASTLTVPQFSIDDFLAQEREKDLLRFSTAGSVDDGKSTLIGRLLYDTQSVYEDQVRSIEGKGTTAPGQIDFALLTDGLRAEREQGITIDVAYRYFSTARRKFIIADTPGHEQYTRNMATGASTADAAVVLIDAAKGVLVQSRRHAYIASLLRVKHVMVAVNKMDLIGYDEAAFRAIERIFRGFWTRSQRIPAMRLRRFCAGERAGWATTLCIGRFDAVVCGAVAAGAAGGAATGARDAHGAVSLSRAAGIAPGSHLSRIRGPDCFGHGLRGRQDHGAALGRSAEVARIVTFDGDLAEAHAPLSVTLVLNRELDISRGDLIASADALPRLRVTSARSWYGWTQSR
jgi:sulfate adenylyltransferase subunit 1